jgi:hypothetical protein
MRLTNQTFETSGAGRARTDDDGIMSLSSYDSTRTCMSLELLFYAYLVPLCTV